MGRALRLGHARGPSAAATKMLHFCRTFWPYVILPLCRFTLCRIFDRFRLTIGRLTLCRLTLWHSTIKVCRWINQSVPKERIKKIISFHNTWIFRLTLFLLGRGGGNLTPPVVFLHNSTNICLRLLKQPVKGNLHIFSFS